MVLVIILIACLLFIGVGYFFCVRLIYPRVYPVEYTYTHEVEEGKIVEADYNAWPKQQFQIASPYGYQLNAIYFPQTGSQKTVVMSHGITWSLFGMVKYMACFYKRGYNVLLYDLRHHGSSGGPNTTFGFYEKHDLKVVVDWAFAQLGPDGKVGTFGESLGGATTLQEAAMDPRLTFVAVDCPYADLRRLLVTRLKKDFHLPLPFLIDIASWWCGRLSGMTIGKVSPIAGIPNIQVPMLFLHGANDAYIPPEHSVDMARAGGERATLYLAPNAGHAQAYWNNREEYDFVLGEFLAKIH
jgi:pimeloyl-ACP methyl ester carboxylesterase